MFPSSAKTRKAKGGSGPAIMIAAAVVLLGGGATYLLMSQGGAAKSAEAGAAAAPATPAAALKAGLDGDIKAFETDLKGLGFTDTTDVAGLAADVNAARSKSASAQVLIGRYRSKTDQRIRNARREVVRQYPGEVARKEAVEKFDAESADATKQARLRWQIEGDLAQARGYLIQTLAYTKWVMVGDEPSFPSSIDAQRWRDDLKRVKEAEERLAAWKKDPAAAVAAAEAEAAKK